MRLQAGVALSDTWLLSLSGDSFQWRPLAPGSAVAPWARSRHGMALLGRVLYVFGGVDASGAALPGGALSTLHLDSLHWAALAPLQGVPHPGPLHSAAMLYMAALGSYAFRCVRAALGSCIVFAALGSHLLQVAPQHSFTKKRHSSR